jgi:hypothetical protein
MRKDLVALWGGLLFSLLVTGLIAWADRFLADVPLLPDAGSSWYYWQLPNPTLWTRLSAWGLYTLHQVGLWGLIFYAQTNRDSDSRKYIAGLHRVNIAALALNAFFIFGHFVQTHLLYDGLAQDTSVWSSQWSVILMLVWILMMENSRRGLFFGKKVPVSRGIIQFARKYHGYVFAWAIVYTFWFHPMVGTAGHLIGFFYMFMLMLQGSLFFTRVHINKWWTVAQEVTVLVHGTLVALSQGPNVWPLFAFGFGGLFVITQMHGLGLPRWSKWLILAGYVGGVLFTYYQIGFERLPQIIAIPLTEYGVALVLALLIGGGLWLRERWRPAGTAALGRTE